MRRTFLTPVGLRRVASLLLPALAGVAWTLSDKPYGIVLSPLLVVGVMLADGPAGRFLAALAYFLAGSYGLPAEVRNFFGSGRLVGVGLWVLSSAALASPWMWVSRGWRAVGVLLVEALPPIGFFGWMSPLSLAGVMYPGWSMAGLAWGLALLWTVAVLARPDASLRDITAARLAAVAVSSAALWANAVYTPPEPPAGWIGVDTRVGRQTDDVMAEVARNQRWIDQAAAAVERARQGAKERARAVVVLPEDVAGTWGPGTAAQVRAAMRPGDVWLVAASVLDGRHWDGRYLDAVVGLGQRGEAVLFASPVPVPGGMWKPWDDEKSYTAAHWWEPVQTVAGVRTWASICYDQLLVWPWLQALVQRPAVVLRVSNYWYEPAGAVVPRVAAAMTVIWARLMGAAVVTAVNRG